MSERRSPERTFSGPRSLPPSLLSRALSLSLSLSLLLSKIFLIYEYYPLLRVAPGAIIKRDGRACVIADIRPRSVRGGARRGTWERWRGREKEQGIEQAPGNRFYLTPDDAAGVVSESRSGRSIRPRMLIARAVSDVSELSRRVNGRSKETAIENTIASTAVGGRRQDTETHFRIRPARSLSRLRACVRTPEPAVFERQGFSRWRIALSLSLSLSLYISRRYPARSTGLAEISREIATR